MSLYDLDNSTIRLEALQDKIDTEFAPDYTGAEPFADDAEISDHAKPSVYYMAKMGIIKGCDETHFAPKNTSKDRTNYSN